MDNLLHFRTVRRRAICRLSLVAAVSLAAGSALLAGSPATAAERVFGTSPTNFVARNATRYAENPDLSSYGLKELIVAYEGSLWPAGADRSQPDTNFIATKYIPKIRNRNPDVVAIDIETWPFTSTMTASEVTANINKFKKVIDVFRRELPNTKLGLYLVMPERNWLAPCGDPKKVASRTSAWHERNLRLQPLADAVDIIFPSLYAFYEDAKSVACWPTYAKANIAEAKIFGKPVWAFLWMKYQTTHNWIPAAQWRAQLETVASAADGLAIWSRAADTDPWSFTAPWWRETAAFMETLSAAEPCTARNPSSRRTSCTASNTPVWNKAALQVSGKMLRTPASDTDNLEQRDVARCVVNGQDVAMAGDSLANLYPERRCEIIIYAPDRDQSLGLDISEEDSEILWE